jgi:hypothetical protein
MPYIPHQWRPREVYREVSIVMTVSTTYKFLAPHPGSSSHAWWVQGRNVPAEVLYRATLGPEPRTLDEIAQDYEVPREAVEEAIDYCVHHADLLQAERDAVVADIHRRGLDRQPATPRDSLDRA